jgi:hypothetical protein
MVGIGGTQRVAPAIRPRAGLCAEMASNLPTNRSPRLSTTRATSGSPVMDLVVVMKILLKVDGRFLLPAFDGWLAVDHPLLRRPVVRSGVHACYCAQNDGGVERERAVGPREQRVDVDPLRLIRPKSAAIRTLRDRIADGVEVGCRRAAVALRQL